MIQLRRSSSHIGEDRRQKIKGGFLSALRQKLHKKEKPSRRLGESPAQTQQIASSNEAGDHDMNSREIIPPVNQNSSSHSKKNNSSARVVCPVPSPIMCARRRSCNGDSGTYRTSREVQECDNTCICQQETSSLCCKVTSNANNSDRNTSGITSSSLDNCNNHVNNESLLLRSIENASDSNQNSEICTSSTEPLHADNAEKCVPSYCESKNILDNRLKNSSSSLSCELFKLSRYGWYWGPITRSEAEKKLVDQCDGAFLVRDSSDDKHLLSLSFRSYGRTLHTRIEYCNGIFSFNHQSEADGLKSVVDLIDHTVSFSLSGVFCYSRPRYTGSPSYPVRLTKPISRFTHVRSLQYLCRFVIRQHTRFDHIQNLPLPERIKGYIEEGRY